MLEKTKNIVWNSNIVLSVSEILFWLLKLHKIVLTNYEAPARKLT